MLGLLSVGVVCLLTAELKTLMDRVGCCWCCCRRPHNPTTVLFALCASCSSCFAAEIVLAISKLSWMEKLLSGLCILLLVTYYVYAPDVLQDYCETSKMAKVLGALSFLAVLATLVQIVFKTSIVEELEEAGVI